MFEVISISYDVFVYCCDAIQNLWYQQANWHQALNHCIANEMRMASVLSQEESDNLSKQIRDSGKLHDTWKR